MTRKGISARDASGRIGTELLEAIADIKGGNVGAQYDVGANPVVADANLKHAPVAHDHAAFRAKAGKRKGFKAAYDALEPRYQATAQALKSRSKSRADK